MTPSSFLDVATTTDVMQMNAGQDLNFEIWICIFFFFFFGSFIFFFVLVSGKLLEQFRLGVETWWFPRKQPTQKMTFINVICADVTGYNQQEGLKKHHPAPTPPNFHPFSINSWLFLPRVIGDAGVYQQSLVKWQEYTPDRSSSQQRTHTSVTDASSRRNVHVSDCRRKPENPRMQNSKHDQPKKTLKATAKHHFIFIKVAIHSANL